MVAPLAYGFYKDAKREWVAKETVRLGRAPESAETSAFTRSQTEAILRGYVALAEDMVDRYARGVIADATPDILRSALKGSFWASVWESFVASVLFTLLLAALVFVAAMMGIGLPIQFTLG